MLFPGTDQAQRTQYVNAQNTFDQLFDMGVVPIVNENDTLAVSVCRALVGCTTLILTSGLGN